MRRFSLLVLAVLLLLPVACAPATDPDPLIQYRRSGGIAGLDDQLVIKTGGQATLTQRDAKTDFTVDRDTLNHLTALFDQVGFAGLNKEYLPEGGNDLFDYAVTYKGHTVHTRDTAVPEKLQPVLDALNEIIEKQAKS